MSESVFEYGSRWLKADFHLHTRADKEFTYSGEDNDFANQYVAALANAGIGLGVITNHNKFDVDEFKALRKKAKKSGIGLLPGIELSIKDGQAGVHTLVVFSDEWINNKENENYIQSFLSVTFAGQANFEQENARSNHDILETIKVLDGYNKDYFLVFAHVEAPNGLWGGLAPGRIKELFDNATVRRRALAFQKVRTRDDRAKIQQALGYLYPAEVEGCDAKNLADMAARKEASYLKLGSFSFEAVKFALRDKVSRVRAELPSYKHSYIQKIRFEGAGTLGGTEICLSPELNTLIGIRGSGKSSVLEGVRYALNIPFGDKSSDVEYKEGLVKHLLRSGGKITIDAIDRRGQPYQIRRILGERPDVYVNGQLQPGVSVRETVLHQPIYFGQKDLSSTGAGFEKDLIEKLLGEALVPIRQKIEQGRQRVVDAINQIKRLNRAATQKQEWLQKKQDAEFKLKFYQQHGVETKLQKQIDFDRDERKAQQVILGAEHYLSELNSFVASFEDELKNQALYKSVQNQIFFDDFFATYQQLIAGFDGIKQTVLTGQSTVALLQQKLAGFVQQKQALKEEFAEIERKLATELKQAGAQAISPQEFKQLKSLLDQADQMLAVLAKSEQQYADLNQSLERELAQLNDLWLEEYRTIEQVLSKINRVDSPLKIVPQFKANKAAMLKHIQDLYRGSRIREATLQSVVDEYSDFASAYRDVEKLKSTLGGSFDTFWQYFEDNLEALLAWQVPNVFTIEYHGKALAHHSLGQRASALMLFVLSQQENDVVIIDQPEDDLDNQTIYDDVIKLIRELKPSTQFIFATHNANIPVLGDAEQVIACEYQDDHIALVNGSIDCADVQQRIVSIMEGGAEAFEKRKQVYEAWKPKNS
ncbi:TrlF family AAA-like ATPase [Vibrio cholerae]|uniref:TrlF family AAA-like ATPase n=1 Tax=Vibrio cholerae TaxID=666 RepID=UPI0010FCF593|nr:histidinol-phosphatase [Vibrio cholerae]TLE15434.1 histidinol-phosphatase [Vibrio cholerae]TLE20407.1 histidinol-phosphatase [Vibrio cholerae]TLE24001.1 histidinol-phosphatase [Vibrio cholerae]TLE31537.1 histidinol-phosphatase [Vibrio cholerae]